MSEGKEDKRRRVVPIPGVCGIMLPLLLLAAYFLSGPYLLPIAELDVNPAVRLWKLRLLLTVVPAICLAAWTWGGWSRRRRIRERSSTPHLPDQALEIEAVVEAEKHGRQEGTDSAAALASGGADSSAFAADSQSSASYAPGGPMSSRGAAPLKAGSAQRLPTLAWRLSETAERIGFRSLLLFAALAALVVFALLNTLLFEHIPRVWDEAGYLFQARVLASGHFSAHAPPSPEHFWIYPLVVWQGRWFAIYPIGHPALLALGVLAGVPWLVGPLLGALSLVLTGLFLREALSERRLAPAGILLFLLSPFVLFMSASYQSHNSCLLGTSIFLLGYARAHARAHAHSDALAESHARTRAGAHTDTPARPCPSSPARSRPPGGRWYSVLAGAGLGLAFLSRSLSAVALALPFLLFEGARLVRGGRERRAALRRGFILSLGFLPFLALLLVQNAAQTGSPLLMGYSIGFPTQTVGLAIDGSQQLGRHGEDFSHTPMNAVRNLRSRVLLLSADLWGWPYLSLVPAALAVLAGWGHRRRAGSPAAAPTAHQACGSKEKSRPSATGPRLPWIALAAGVVASLLAAYTLFWSPGYGYGARYYYETLPLLLLLTLEGLAWLGGGPLSRKDVQAEGQAVNPASSGVRGEKTEANATLRLALRADRVLLLTAALVAVNLFFYLPVAYRQYDHLPHYDNVDRRLERMVERAGLENALVFVESWFLGYYDYTSAFPLNRPDLSGNVFARDLGEEKNRALAAALPGKSAYGFRFDEASGDLILSRWPGGETVLREPGPPGRKRYPPGRDPAAQERYWRERRERIAHWGG